MEASGAFLIFFLGVTILIEGCSTSTDHTLVNTGVESATETQNTDYLIGPIPEVASVKRGESHVLHCQKKVAVTAGVIAWLEFFTDYTDTTIFQGATPVDTDTKYDNFGIITNNQYIWNLEISNIETSDEGTYGCRYLNTGETHKASRSVEVRASSHKILMGDGVEPIGGTITSTDGYVTTILCRSVGTRPSVDMNWYERKFDAVDWTEISAEFSQIHTAVNPDDHTLFDTTSTLTYMANGAFNNGKLKCRSEGQLAFPELEIEVFLDIQFAPYLALSYRPGLITCTPSDCNPPAREEDATIIVGKDYEYPYWGFQADVKLEKETEVTCTLEHSARRVSTTAYLGGACALNSSKHHVTVLLAFFMWIMVRI